MDENDLNEKTFWAKYVTKSNNKINHKLSKQLEADTYYNHIKNKYNWADTYKECFHCYINNITKQPVCKKCNTPVEFNNKLNKYKQFCSAKCSATSLEVREKYKRKCLEKYGTVNAFSSEQVKQKIKKTNLQKYGVERIGSSPEVIKKIKN